MAPLPPEIRRYFDGEGDPEDLLDDEECRLRVLVDTHIFIWCDRQLLVPFLLV